MTLELCKELLAQARRDYGPDAPVTKWAQGQVEKAKQDEKHAVRRQRYWLGFRKKS